MRLSKAASFCGLLAFSSAVLHAGVTYNYSGSDQSLGVTYTLTAGGSPSIVASGFTGLGGTLATATIYGKNNGGDEVGLGLTNDPSHDNEVTPGSFIMLNMTAVDPITSLYIYTNSSTGSDKWAIWGSNTAISAGQSYSMPGSGVISGTSEGSQNLASLDGYKYIYFGAQSGNVLLGSITIATPEPGLAGVVALLGSGLFAFRRRRLVK